MRITTLKVECKRGLGVAEFPAACSRDSFKVGEFSGSHRCEERVVGLRIDFSISILWQTFGVTRDSVGKGVLFSVRFHGSNRTLTLSESGTLSQIQ
jgi:hypothetical protein